MTAVLPVIDVAQRALFGAEARLHHVGVAVRSIAAVDDSLETFPDEALGVSMAFLSVGGVRLELLEPVGDNSPIATNLRDGVKLVHLCYEVPDLDAALAAGKQHGFRRVAPIAPQPVYDGARVTWVFNKHFGLFELIERP